MYFKAVNGLTELHCVWWVGFTLLEQSVPLFTTRSINVWSRIQSWTQASTHSLSMSLSALQTFDLLEYVCRFLSVKQNTHMIQNSCIWNLDGNKKMWFLLAMLAAYFGPLRINYNDYADPFPFLQAPPAVQLNISATMGWIAQHFVHLFMVSSYISD